MSAPDPSTRIVLIDDDEFSRTPFCEFLRFSGFEVDEFETADQALEAIGRDLPAAVVLDITLAGDVDGYECARRLRAAEATKDLILVALSGHAQSDIRAKGVRFDDVFRKPIDPDELASHLRTLLAERAR
jgi:DNA-binding response OmpR family regulator